MNERYRLNAQLAQMLKGGVIMDVTNPEQARIAEAAGACAVMALGKIPADIRAPYIEAIGEGVQVLAKVDDKIVAAQYGKQLALAFHPELDAAESTAVHENFLRMCENK